MEAIRVRAERSRVTFTLSSSGRKAVRLGLPCLLAGAITSIAIAAVGTRTTGESRKSTRQIPSGGISVVHANSWGREVYSVMISVTAWKPAPRSKDVEMAALLAIMEEVPPPSWAEWMPLIMSHLGPEDPDPIARGDAQLCDFYAAGWPYRCVYGSQFVASFQNTTNPVRVGYRYVNMGGHTYWFPTTIMWPGFLLNSLLIGAVWCGVIVGSESIRRRRRVRRGLCPRCGYSLKDQPTPGCPECGWMRSARHQGERG